jgi:Lar family restriction alleviation protein
VNSEQLAVSSELLAEDVAKLLACPFCGGTAEMSTGMREYWVYCPCDASGPMADTEADAAAGWNRREGVSRGGAEGAEGELVSLIRWTRVADRLPYHGQFVAVWIPAVKQVVRAYRVAMTEGDWRVCGVDGPRVVEGLVTAWAEIPNGVLPAPDNGGAA